MTISVVGLVGAGFMGSGIAECLAAAGKQVVVHEPHPAALERSRQGIAASVGAAIARGDLSQDDGKNLLARIRYTAAFEPLRGVARLSKRLPRILASSVSCSRALTRSCRRAQFLASNTSSIPIAELAAATTRRERVLGTHFFSPVQVMKLVEIVLGLHTSGSAVAAAERLVLDIDKQSIRTKDRSGFTVNMLLVPYLMSAVRMQEEGFASREDIDTAMKLGCGHPMGPLTLCDFIGPDVLYAICNALQDEFRRPEYAPPPMLRRMVVSGLHGRKTGRGFYHYPGAGELVAVAA